MYKHPFQNNESDFLYQCIPRLARILLPPWEKSSKITPYPRGSLP